MRAIRSGEALAPDETPPPHREIREVPGLHAAPLGEEAIDPGAVQQVGVAAERGDAAAHELADAARGPFLHGCRETLLAALKNLRGQQVRHRALENRLQLAA